jgi:branched-chain amino acid transport system ATP-binding protein
MSVLLSTEKLMKRFGGVVALNGVSITVPRGRRVLIVGPNGSGKTTLVNVITGIMKPDRGRVLFNVDDEPVDITGWPPHRIYGLGIARSFQNPQVFGSLSVIENLLVSSRDSIEDPFSSIRGSWVVREEELLDRAMEVLSMVGLGESWDKPASKLSGGQLKLLELGRALMAGARLIILDEPLAGVAPKLAYELLGVIEELSRRGVTFLVVEHRIDLVLDYMDHAYAMANGSVVASGDPHVVINDPAVVESYLGG